MGDDQKQELKRDLKHFWHKCTQIPKFKYWKWIILIICTSGIYSFYFVQNHAFALNNYQDTIRQFRRFKKPSENQANVLQYAFTFPKYGKFQDNEHLIVKQPLRNIQTIRDLHTFIYLKLMNYLIIVSLYTNTIGMPLVMILLTQILTLLMKRKLYQIVIAKISMAII